MPQALLATEAETAQILGIFGNDKPGALAFLERQLNALHLRAQVVIGFAAVAVTTTGFSGRLIAGTHVTAQVCIITGLSIILAACLLIFVRVLSVEWVVSRYLQDDFAQSISQIIRYRNRKTAAYRIGSLGVFAGLCIYAVSIGIMLLNPEPLSVPVR